MNKPSIVEIISQRVELRKAGKEFTGRCPFPFHEDTTPSFSVNDEKGLFHCFGCGTSGDVVDFVMKLDGLTFPEACANLGMQPGKPPHAPSRGQIEAAELAAAWMLEQQQRIGVLLGDVLEQIELADEISDSELAESLLREQSFLRDLYDDLEISCNAAALLLMRAVVEALTEGVEPPEIHFDFPELTPEYRAKLKAYAGGYS